MRRATAEVTQAEEKERKKDALDIYSPVFPLALTECFLGTFKKMFWVWQFLKTHGLQTRLCKVVSFSCNFKQTEKNFLALSDNFDCFIITFRILIASNMLVNTVHIATCNMLTSKTCWIVSKKKILWVFYDVESFFVQILKRKIYAGRVHFLHDEL